MPTEPIGAKGLIRAVLAHGFDLRSDEPADKLTTSPELEEYLKLVLPTTRSTSKTFR
jgi:hypothetical protein